jgi:hypothetical protein
MEILFKYFKINLQQAKIAKATTVQPRSLVRIKDYR